MNGPHDLGGQMGFGTISPEQDEPVFHSEWERRVFALTLAAGALGQWTIDMSRQARERIPPAEYLASSYYEIWLKGLVSLMTERGLVWRDELARGRMELASLPTRGRLQPSQVAAMLARGGASARPTERPARFAAGERVRTRNIHPESHTRLPRYARDKPGTIELVHGAHVYPDSSAAARGDDPHWLYTVRFSARTLWGDDKNPRDHVHLALWEPYLEPA